MDELTEKARSEYRDCELRVKALCEGKYPGVELQLSDDKYARVDGDLFDRSGKRFACCEIKGRKEGIQPNTYNTVFMQQHKIVEGVYRALKYGIGFLILLEFKNPYQYYCAEWSADWQFTTKEKDHLNNARAGTQDHSFTSAYIPMKYFVKV